MKNNPFDKFTSDVLHMIVFAKATSIDANVDVIHPESFLIGILLTGENVVTESLDKYGLDTEDCMKRLKNILANKTSTNEEETRVNYDNIDLSKEIILICSIADEIAIENGHDFIGVGHIFCAIMRYSKNLRYIFSKKCKKFSSLTDSIIKEGYSERKFNEVFKDKKRKEHPKVSDSIKSYCLDLTKMASEGKFDPILSRDKEIEEAITILCRRSKSNPILIGEAGVGKTAIVEGIAQRIVSGTVPKKLKGYKIYSLNMSSIVAGTKYRGDFEKRIQQLIRSLENDKNSIIFIDEIHTIVGAGGAGSAMDAANLLKPALARDLKCIGATTNGEYKKYVENDGALARRFGVVKVEEPSDKQVKNILNGIKCKYEEYHSCIIPEDTVNSIVELTKRYRPTKFFPDKAIDCMDIACAKYSWKNGEEEVPVITEDDIAKVIGQQSNVPVEIIKSENNVRIKNIENGLREKIVGQEEAVSSVCRVLKNAYSGVRNPDKPMGVLLFGGPSGTGKTYLSKELSKMIFGNEKSLIRIDMTEYTEEHSISKIIGSPPGYTGFKENDVVVDKIKERPYSVLLLDEIEKSHPKVMKVFLQAMSDGIITSAVGERIDCKNLFFIMTGNFDIGNYNSCEMGFTKESINEIEEKKNKIIYFCEKMYGKEFINRVDKFVPFSQLTDEEVLAISGMRLKEFSERVSNEDLKVVIGRNICKAILEEHKRDHGSNAMSIERIISTKVEPLVADAIIESNEKKGEKRTLTINANKENVFSVSLKKS